MWHRKPSKSLRRTSSNLFELIHSNFLSDTSPKPRETKANMNYWHLIKIKKNLLHSKEKSTKLKGRLQNARRHLQVTYLIQGHYPKSIKNLSNSTPKNPITQLRNEQKTCMDTLQRRNPDSSTSLIIREIQIKTMSYHLIPVRMAKIHNTRNKTITQRIQYGFEAVHAPQCL